MALAIASSVGGGGTNHAADLHSVRVALNSIPIRKGGPSPELPANASVQQISAAITAVQNAASVVQPFVAGRIDPSGTTFTALNQLSEAPRDTGIRFAPVAKMLTLMALNQLTLVEANIANPSAINGTVLDALAAHFHLNPVTLTGNSTHASLTKDTLRPIKTNYKNLIAVLGRARNFFLNASDRAATFPRKQGGTFVARAFTRFQQSTSFNRDFKFIGRFAQVAIIIHETVHFVDNGKDDIAEWDRTNYDLLMTARQARHNPSSYAAFAFHAAYGSDFRPGAGNLDSGGVEGSSATPSIGTPPPF
jgi:hypothetical protein